MLFSTFVPFFTSSHLSSFLLHFLSHSHSLPLHPSLFPCHLFSLYLLLSTLSFFRTFQRHFLLSEPWQKRFSSFLPSFPCYIAYPANPLPPSPPPRSLACPSPCHVLPSTGQKENAIVSVVVQVKTPLRDENDTTKLTQQGNGNQFYHHCCLRY
ncbi:hypothetical protein E2C01_099871 [Portunus trituberculatus]|uniref:Uncharacterized protein n=1 Tax=Portunus trituberculatus TaxID=210409 RepID=A0A5B7KC16_PORTR|nr:hypothetical protein [Portunus trituberculatus]